MELLVDRTSFVIVGRWNPAILQPEWLLRKAFEYPEGEKHPVQMEFAPIPGASPKFTIEGISIVPNRDKLMMYPNTHSDGQLNRVEQIAINILTLLPHTPIQGVGFNFEYKDEEPSEELIRLFRIDERLDNDRDSNVLGMEIVYHIEISEHCILNLKQVLSSDDSIIFNFNYHFTVNNAPEALEHIRDNFIALRENSIQMLNRFNIDINGGEDHVEANATG